MTKIQEQGRSRTFNQLLKLAIKHGYKKPKIWTCIILRVRKIKNGKNI